MILGQVIPEHTLNVSHSNPYLLEIDIEAAWKEMELQPGWGNEVTVQIFVNQG
jgi:hypothetical protein